MLLAIYYYPARMCKGEAIGSVIVVVVVVVVVVVDTNSVYLLVIIAMPFNCAHYAYACAFCSCAQLASLVCTYT